MSEKTSSGQQQKSIVLYILIAFGITWLCWIPALVGSTRQGFALPTISNFARMGEQASLTGQQRLLTSLFNFAVYGPLIASLALTFWETGKEGLTDLLRRIVKLKVSLKWYGIAIGSGVGNLVYPPHPGTAYRANGGGRGCVDIASGSGALAAADFDQRPGRRTGLAGLSAAQTAVVVWQRKSCVDPRHDLGRVALSIHYFRNPVQYGGCANWADGDHAGDVFGRADNVLDRDDLSLCVDL